ARPDQAGDDPAVLAAKYSFGRGANFSRGRHWSSANLLARGNGGDRADLDAPLLALARGRDLCGPRDRLIEVLAVEDVIPGELFLCLGERTVEYEWSAVLLADRRGSRVRLYRTAGGHVCLT